MRLIHVLFSSLRNSRADGQHYRTVEWPTRRAATGGGGAKGGGAPLKKNFAFLKCLACPAKLPFPLQQFQDDGRFFFWKPTEN